MQAAAAFATMQPHPAAAAAGGLAGAESVLDALFASGGPAMGDKPEGPDSGDLSSSLPPGLFAQLLSSAMAPPPAAPAQQQLQAQSGATGAQGRAAGAVNSAAPAVAPFIGAAIASTAGTGAPARTASMFDTAVQLVGAPAAPTQPQGGLAAATTGPLPKGVVAVKGWVSPPPTAQPGGHVAAVLAAAVGVEKAVHAKAAPSLAAPLSTNASAAPGAAASAADAAQPAVAEVPAAAPSGASADAISAVTTAEARLPAAALQAKPAPATPASESGPTAVQDAPGAKLGQAGPTMQARSARLPPLPLTPPPSLAPPSPLAHPAQGLAQADASAAQEAAAAHTVKTGAAAVQAPLVPANDPRTAASPVGGKAPQPGHPAANAAGPAAATAPVASASERGQAQSRDAGQHDRGPAAQADSGQAGATGEAASPQFQVSAATTPGATASSVLSQTAARLSAELVRKVQAKASRFNLALMPAGLGRVDVKLHIAASGVLTAALHFDTPQAAEALKAHAGELRAALEQAGFNLADSGLSFTAGGFGREAQDGPGSQPRPVHAFGAAAAAAEETALAAAAPAASGGVDIRI